MFVVGGKIMLQSNGLNKEMLDAFKYWILERHRIHIAKDIEHLPPPWTEDKILQTYRFCNVHREDDTVTRWIKENIRDPHDGDPYLWLNVTLARIINWPQTLAEIGYVERWDAAVADYVRRTVQARQLTGKKTFTSAYMVTGTESKGMSKINFTILLVGRVWTYKEELCQCSRLAEAEEVLTQAKGISTFLAGQIIADMKYTVALRGADDWWTWCAPGPGSVRGLNRLHNRPIEKQISVAQFRAEMDELMTQIPAMQLHAQDVQNCLCEFDKWCRVKFNEGTAPKQMYVPHEERT